MRNEPDEFPTLQDIVRRARINLNKGTWDYLVGGAESEATVKRNRMAIESIEFRARVLRDVSKIDCMGSLLGRKLRIPVLLAPIGSLESFESGGGSSSAKASEAFQVPHMLSSRCAPGLEEVASAANNDRIFQLYVRGDWGFIEDHARRAIDNGYYAFCLTVDVAHYSRRERDTLNRFVKSWRSGATGMDHQAALNWDDVKRFKDTFDIPLILKGIQVAEDAAIAVEHGADGIYVSNHGGRQIDHGQGSIGVLPDVVKAVDGKAAIIVDGGFYRGSDVVKAIALGADCVGLGRLQGYGMAAGGTAGVIRALELIEEEIEITLGLLGLTGFDKIDPSYVQPGLPLGPAHQFSAWPHLNLDIADY